MALPRAEEGSEVLRLWRGPTGLATRVTIFGVSWDELEPQDVAAFLADAEDEALRWESKGGGGRPNPGSVRKAVCGFANSRGGYLIIGADRRDGAWSVDGVDFGVDEPGTWLDSVIRD